VNFVEYTDASIAARALMGLNFVYGLAARNHAVRVEFMTYVGMKKAA
jgi:hypothetical protein